jgi:hypothetical protein
MSNPDRGRFVASALLYAACSGFSKRDAPLASSRPLEHDALCGVELAAKWAALDGPPSVSVDCTPIWGPTFIDNEPTVLGGTKVATFASAGVPSYALAPEPNATQMTVDVPVECAKLRRTIRMRIDIRHPQRAGPVPFTLDPCSSDIGVRVPSSS